MRINSFSIAFERQDAKPRNTLMDVIRAVRRNGYRIERSLQRGEDDAEDTHAELYVEYVGAAGDELVAQSRILALLGISSLSEHLLAFA